MRLTGSLGNEIGSLVDASNHIILVLELGELGGDDTEDDILVLWELGERLETAGTGSVVFEVVSVYVQVLTQC